MTKRLQNWFIGQKLQETSETIEQARITLLYQILLVTLLFIIPMLPVMAAYAHYVQLVRSSLIVAAFSFLLFSLKYFRSARLVSHGILIISVATMLIDIYLIFQQVNGVSYLLSVVNIVFAFYFYTWRWTLFYLCINIGAVLLFMLLSHVELYHVGFAAREMSFPVYFFSVLVFFILIILILLHFRKAARLATALQQEALEAQKQTTEKYVRLNQELGEAKKKAEEANRLKTNFLNNMSHEIRTPLNGILGIAQIIDMETDNPQIREYIAIQKKSGERLLHTINSILHLSRLEAEQSQFQFTRIEVNELVGECFVALKTLAAQKRLSYTFIPYPRPLYCLGEAPLLYQVMSNLIGNAIKFTQTGSIVVSTGISEVNSNFLLIRVQDTGIGIGEEFLEKVFHSFLQESSGQARKYEGSGLGLSIARKYVELLGGTITIKSIKGLGSTFEVLLPVHTESVL